jgi:deoxyribodipyrimidine photo-lyase
VLKQPQNFTGCNHTGILPAHGDGDDFEPETKRLCRSMTCLVWLKRDLRWRDHAPLAAAAEHPGALALWLIEPAWLESPEFDPQHLAFALKCVDELRETLAARGLGLIVRVGEALQTLTEVRRQHPFAHLYSHEETGPGWSYVRDKAVARWCREQSVSWRQFPQNGVIRPLASRSGWAARWSARMNATEVAMPAQINGARLAWEPLPSLHCLGIGHSRPIPQAGEAAAWHTLESFLAERAQGYRKNLSSPRSAEQGCSRLSAHLAFGTISMRCVHQATERAIAATPDRMLAYNLRGFTSRLRWHCHFIQKLEDEPQIEFRNFSRACDGLRESEFDRERFEAWCEGRTGFALVDACMRSLRATGWLNFRMRAMLVSFAAHHLWLHWREPGVFLARQFLDFEPGIHWSQMQMQSATTGINTLRIYSPTKQALDQDPDQIFIRRWVPEYGTHAYPAPIVDERDALRVARMRLAAIRASAQAKLEADRIQQRHGSRKAGLPPSPKPRRSRSRRSPPTSSAQLTLDLILNPEPASDLKSDRS